MMYCHDINKLSEKEQKNKSELDKLKEIFGNIIKIDINNNDINIVRQIRILPPHRCRHTFATFLSARGVDIKIIQSILGHADIKMTSHYTHDSLDGMKNAVSGFKYQFPVPQ